MKKQELLARYSELKENRNNTASESIDAMLKLSLSHDLSTAEHAHILDGVASLALWDEENDQQEIANLIAVANSDHFGVEIRHEAGRRVIIMLEIGDKNG